MTVGSGPRLRALLWLVLAALAAVFVLREMLPAQSRLTSGFMAYYAAGDLIASRADPHQLYDAELFGRRVFELSHGTVHDVYLGNTPALAVAWMPMSHLSVEAARSLWVALDGLFMLVIVLRTSAWVSPAHRLLAAVLLAALLTLSAPARDQVLHAQMYGLMLLLHTFGMHAHERKQEALTGIALALTMMLKLSGWPIVVLLVLRRRWRALGAMALAALALFWLSLQWIGIDVWREAVFVQMPASAAAPTAKLSAYQTMSSLWQHLFSFDSAFNPHPVANLPQLAKAALVLTTVAGCAVLLFRDLSRQVQYAAALVLTVLLSPLAEQYHYVLVLLPLALLFMHSYFTASRGLGGVLIVAALLIAAPIDYKTYQSGWRALLDYPRLAGGCLVFVSLLRVKRLQLTPR